MASYQPGPVPIRIEYPRNTFKRDAVTGGGDLAQGLSQPLLQKLAQCARNQTDQDLNLPLIALKNTSTDCYRNVTLLMLLNLKPFLNFLYMATEHHSGAPNSLTLLRDIADVLWNGGIPEEQRLDTIMPLVNKWYQFLQTTKGRASNGSEFSTWASVKSRVGQADAVEFASYCFDRAFNVDLIGNDQYVLDLLCKTRLVSRRAYGCSCDAKVRQPFGDNDIETYVFNLNANAQKAPLATLIANGMYDQLNQTAQCPGCKTKQQYDEYRKFKYLPEMFFIGLTHTMQTTDAHGVTTTRQDPNAGTDMPDKIDLSYLQDYQPSNGVSQAEYQLQSVVAYRGTGDAGHYYIHIRRPDNTWTVINDVGHPRLKDLEDKVKLKTNFRPRILAYVRVQKSPGAPEVARSLQLPTSRDRAPRTISHAGLPNTAASNATAPTTSMPAATVTNIIGARTTATATIANTATTPGIKGETRSHSPISGSPPPDTTNWSLAKFKSEFKGRGISTASRARIETLRRRWNDFHAASEDDKLRFLLKPTLVRLALIQNLQIDASATTASIINAIIADRNARNANKVSPETNGGNPPVLSAASQPAQDSQLGTSVVSARGRSRSTRATAISPRLPSLHRPQPHLALPAGVDTTQSQTPGIVVQPQPQPGPQAGANTTQSQTLDEGARLNAENSRLLAEIVRLKNQLTTNKRALSELHEGKDLLAVQLESAQHRILQLEDKTNKQNADTAPQNATRTPKDLGQQTANIRDRDQQPVTTDQRAGSGVPSQRSSRNSNHSNHSNHSSAHQGQDAQSTSRGPIARITRKPSEFRVLKVTVKEAVKELDHYNDEVRYIPIPNYVNDSWLTTNQWTELYHHSPDEGNSPEKGWRFKVYVTVQGQDGAPSVVYGWDIEYGQAKPTQMHPPLIVELLSNDESVKARDLLSSDVKTVLVFSFAAKNSASPVLQSNLSQATAQRHANTDQQSQPGQKQISPQPNDRTQLTNLDEGRKAVTTTNKGDPVGGSRELSETFMEVIVATEAQPNGNPSWQHSYFVPLRNYNPNEKLRTTVHQRVVNDDGFLVEIDQWTCTSLVDMNCICHGTVFGLQASPPPSPSQQSLPPPRSPTPPPSPPVPRGVKRSAPDNGRDGDDDGDDDSDNGEPDPKRQKIDAGSTNMASSMTVLSNNAVQSAGVEQVRDDTRAGSGDDHQVLMIKQKNGNDNNEDKEDDEDSNVDADDEESSSLESDQTHKQLSNPSMSIEAPIENARNIPEITVEVSQPSNIHPQFSRSPSKEMDWERQQQRLTISPETQLPLLQPGSLPMQSTLLLPGSGPYDRTDSRLPSPEDVSMRSASPLKVEDSSESRPITPPRPTSVIVIEDSPPSPPDNPFLRINGRSILRNPQTTNPSNIGVLEQQESDDSDIPYRRTQTYQQQRSYLGQQESDDTDIPHRRTQTYQQQQAYRDIQESDDTDVTYRQLQNHQQLQPYLGQQDSDNVTDRQIETYQQQRAYLGQQGSNDMSVSYGQSRPYQQQQAYPGQGAIVGFDRAQLLDPTNFNSSVQNDNTIMGHQHQAANGKDGDKDSLFGDGDDMDIDLEVPASSPAFLEHNQPLVVFDPNGSAAFEGQMLPPVNVPRTRNAELRRSRSPRRDSEDHDIYGRPNRRYRQRTPVPRRPSPPEDDHRDTPARHHLVQLGNGNISVEDVNADQRVAPLTNGSSPLPDYEDDDDVVVTAARTVQQPHTPSSQTAPVGQQPQTPLSQAAPTVLRSATTGVVFSRVSGLVINEGRDTSPATPQPDPVQNQKEDEKMSGIIGSLQLDDNENDPDVIHRRSQRIAQKEARQGSHSYADQFLNRIGLELAKGSVATNDVPANDVPATNGHQNHGDDDDDDDEGIL